MKNYDTESRIKKGNEERDFDDYIELLDKIVKTAHNNIIRRGKKQEEQNIKHFKKI